MNKEDSVFLKHILESIDILEKYTKDVTEEEFLHSTEKQDLAMRRLEIIGEAVRNLSEEFRMKHSILCGIRQWPREIFLFITILAWT